MSFQDYYNILECTPQASLLEIKKSYRALAWRFHPDRNNGDPKATQYFQEIQAAYEVLSNPLKRKSYDNELKVKGQYSTFAKDSVGSVENVLRQSKDLVDFINGLDRRVINSDALTDFVLGLLHKDNMAMFLRRNDADYNAQLCNNLLLASKSIVSSKLFGEIAAQLFLLLPDENSVLHQRITNEINSRRQKERQNKLVPYAALVIVAVVILIMYMILFF